MSRDTINTKSNCLFTHTTLKCTRDNNNVRTDTQIKYVPTVPI
jgi:hypothetical protein